MRVREYVGRLELKLIVGTVLARHSYFFTQYKFLYDTLSIQTYGLDSCLPFRWAPKKKYGTQQM